VNHTQNQQKRGTFASIGAHFHFYRALYGILISLGAAVWGITVALGQTWLASQIDERIEAKLEGVKRDIASIRKEVRCEALNSRISALRAELRDIETDLFQAEQQSNTPLILQLRERQSMIADSLSDQIQAYNFLSCTVL